MRRATIPRSFTFTPVAARAAAEQACFGGPITVNDYGDLVGDISNDATGTVEFNQLWPSHNAIFAIQIRAQTSLFRTTIRINPNDFHYCDVRVFVTGTGTGYQALRLLAAKVQSYNFPCLHAAGAKFISQNNPALNEWGYRAYPKYGFDADIPAVVIPTLAPAFAGMTRISQLIATPAGKAEWAAKGVQVNNLEFDLSPGYSWNTLNALPP